MAASTHSLLLALQGGRAPPCKSQEDAGLIQQGSSSASGSLQLLTPRPANSDGCVKGGGQIHGRKEGQSSFHGCQPRCLKEASIISGGGTPPRAECQGDLQGLVSPGPAQEAAGLGGGHPSDPGGLL